MKISRGITVCIIGLIIAVSMVQAAGTLDIDPRRISPNGVTTITFTSIGDNLVDKIEIEGPDGTIYVKDYSPNILLHDGDELNEDFGTGISGWTPEADSSLEGWYYVEVIGFDGELEAEDYFDCSRRFYVPEFSIPVPLVMAISFILLGFLYKIRKPF